MRARFASLLALIVLAGSGLAVIASQQTATAADPPRYGDPVLPSDSYPVRETWLYLENWAGTIPERPIVAVDTEHATDKGFYFAVRNPTIPANERQINWVFRPYGLECGMAEYYNLVFNPWLNTYFCAADPDAFEVYAPGYSQKLAECQAAQGQPWKWTESYNNWNCSNFNVSWDEVPLGWQGTQSTRCAPWETVAECNDLSWNTKPLATWWVPQPDACVGVRSDINKFGTSAKGFRTTDADVNQNVPNCDGSSLAPNCTPAQSNSPSCGGPIDWVAAEPTPTPTPTSTSTPTPTPTATPTAFTETVDVTDTYTITGTATATETATQRVLRQTVRVKVTRRIDGRKVTKRAKQAIYTNGTASATSTVTLSEDFQGYGDGTCTRPSQAEARACAEAAAEEAAELDAHTRLQPFMDEEAATAASAEARQQAKADAAAAAAAAPVTKAMLRAAKRQARKAALAKF